MNVETLTVDRETAHQMWKKYQTHRHNQSKIDADIERIYKVIAEGKVVINALASIVGAGLNAEKLPKLAIARADARTVFLNASSDGSATMASDMRYVTGRTAKNRFSAFQRGAFPGINTSKWDCRALVPHIPPDIRPKRGLQNYHVLWEVEVWEMVPPVDPMLLRRMGEDIWLVCGAWDLTPVERAVMGMHKPRQ